MNFSKLNPKNWFKGDPRATGLPKYKVGQRCLVIKYTNNRFVGQEVILQQCLPRYRLADVGRTVAAWSWVTDLSKPFLCPIEERLTQCVFPEAWMIPIDDEDLNEELRNEVIDDFGTKKVQFERHLEKLDKALADLEKAVKRSKEKKQAI